MGIIAIISFIVAIILLIVAIYLSGDGYQEGIKRKIIFILLYTGLVATIVAAITALIMVFSS